MITGKLLSNNLEIEVLPPIIKETLNLLKKADLEKIKKGKYEIIKDEIFLIIDEYQTEKPEEKKAEQHRIYIDVQYIISGKETIGFGYEDNENEIFNEYDLSKECTLFNTVKNEEDIILQKGAYAIFFPSDIHRPGLNADGQQVIKKGIVKINKNLLYKKEIENLEINIPPTNQ